MRHEIVHGAGPSKNLAIVKDGVVVNVVKVPEEWTGAGEGDWPVPDGCKAVACTCVHIGDRHDGKKFLRKVLWNDLAGKPVPDFEIDPENPPAEVIPIVKPVG